MAKEIKAHKLPSGSWRCQPSFTDDDGNRHRTSITEPTEKKAIAKALAWQQGIIRQVEERKNVTLDRAIDEYIETCRASKRSVTTIDGYRSMQRNAYPLIINKRVKSITIRDIQKQMDERAKTVKPKTIHNNFSLIESVMAIQRPDLDLSIIRLPEIDEEEMQIPDDNEARLLMDAAMEDKDLYCAVLLAITTGLRRSEICALEWSDIDEEEGTLSVSKAMVKDRESGLWIIKCPKKKSSRRVISIAPTAIEALKKNRTGLRYIVNIKPDAVTERFSRLRDRLNMPEIHLHSLRHYRASVLLCLGLERKIARRMLGHATDHMVDRVYGHLVSGAKTEAEARADAHAEALLKGEKITYLPVQQSS